MYTSSLGDPDLNERVRNHREDLKSAESSGYATVFRNSPTNTGSNANTNVWIKRKTHVHHPPFLTEPNCKGHPNAEWNTAEAVEKLIDIFIEKQSTLEDHRLREDAKQIFEWIESREPHHFQDDVNDEETIRNAVGRLEEIICEYYDGSTGN